MTPILTAVLVLYERSPEQSESFTSLQHILLGNPAIAAQLSLLIYDNSPEPHVPPPLPIAVAYVHNPANPGLATAYNVALESAASRDEVWLMLLDQDTVLTTEYLRDALAILPEVSGQVVALLPQLVQDGHVHSPQLLPRLSTRALPPDFHGVPKEPITAFNSAAVLRVEALQCVGGFPPAFPLDFLDHAVFDALSVAGGAFYVMQSRLAHNLSTTRLGGDASLDRYKKVLAAEHRFYAGVGGGPACWKHLRRLKQAAGHLLKVRDKRFARWDLRAAFGLVRD